MKRIAMLVNSEDMMVAARQAIDESNEDISVLMTHTYKESSELARRLVNEGCKIIIARGGHAWRLRKMDLGIPVVQIPFTGSEVAAIMQQAARDHEAFAVVGGHALVSVAKEMSAFFEARVHYFEVTDWQDFESQIFRLKSSGLSVVVGGYDASNYAKANNLISYCVSTSVHEIRTAITDAINILEVNERDKRWNNLFRTVLDTINEGVILVDRDAKISHMNQRARKLMGNYAVGSRIDDPVYLRQLKRVFQSGESIHDELTEDNNYKFSTTIIPIHSDKHIAEAVMVLQEIEYVRKVEQRVRQKVAQKGLVATKTFDNILGESSSTQAAINTAKRYALVNATVLITGESGTGKEVYAQSIHNYSARKNEAFVAANCAAIPANLLESELFGYAEGAFTGAKRGGKIGLFELAHNGTIFLDEIGETSLEMQARLLRVLEEHKIMRIGDDRVIPVNIRIIAATNKNLRQMVKEGKFRGDLFYRLNVLSLSLEPLRKRKADLNQQIDFFMERYASEHGRNKFRFTEAAMQIMMQYDWPGNTRELKNIIERLIVTNSSGVVDAEEIREAIGEMELDKTLSQAKLIDAAEHDVIRQVMNETGGNKSAAAKLLGISRPTLDKKLKMMENARLNRNWHESC